LDLTLWQQSFNNVGWFIPPYVHMGALSKMVGEIQARGSQYGQDDLERALMQFNGPGALAPMVMHRYPVVPVIKD
jgi:hypothetical protein